MKLKFCIFVILIFAFQACEKKVDNRFTKTWYDTEYRTPGRTTMQIKNDSTFNYRAASCMWRCTSKGNWKVFGDTIELNSTSIDTCYNMFPFADCPKYGTYYDKKILSTIPNCTAESETDYIIFKNEKFYLKKDSHMRKANSNCPDSLSIVFAKTEKKKKNGY
ncbi:hypothetical protein [Flavobacterium sp. ZS1P14]|uniref:hypothetical protein n=1 Tax=Flavobacterium sp. ZS1P14 TaxID=3401729 RepID=UPI003AB02A38